MVKQEQEQERSCGIAIVASMVVSKGLGSLRCKLTTTRRLETVKRSANGSPAHGAYSQRQGRERNAQKNQWSRHVVRASADSETSETSNWQNWAPADESGTDGETYEVNLPKPIGVSFARGNDGRCYITRVNAARGSIDPRIQPGDKLLEVSQSFGSETWEALNYGQVMYAIRTRNGDVYLKLLSRGGDLSVFEKEEMDATAKAFANERAGGNYGYGTQELQQRNYIKKKEDARKRRELFDDGLEKFQSGDYENALLDWENVLGLEPANYMSDSFAMVSDIYQVAAYNTACCYCKMDQMEAALEALELTLSSGFDDYKKIRTDPNLSKLQNMSQFKPLMDKYDEPIFNEDVANAFKNLFGFGKK